DSTPLGLERTHRRGVAGQRPDARPVQQMRASSAHAARSIRGACLTRAVVMQGSKRRAAMTRLLGVSCLVCGIAIAPAHAQILLDVAKISCGQFTGYKITNPQNIANWLSGFYNGKRGNTM